MGSAVLTLPDDVKAELKRFSWVNWSELAREELLKQERLKKAWGEAEKIVSRSRLTQEQADRLADEVSSSISKRYMKMVGK